MFCIYVAVAQSCKASRKIGPARELTKLSWLCCYLLLQESECHDLKTALASYDELLLSYCMPNSLYSLCHFERYPITVAVVPSVLVRESIRGDLTTIMEQLHQCKPLLLECVLVE